MIPHLHEPVHIPHSQIAEALGHSVSSPEDLASHTVVAAWPGLDRYTLDGEQWTWTARQWAEHLQDPYLEHPFAASPNGDRHAILHLEVDLHPDDRALTRHWWSEIAHRLARTATIELPGKESLSCRWVAFQALPGRLDLIANLITLDGAWHSLPDDVVERLEAEARLIEQDLGLTPSRAARPAPTSTALLASVLAQLADEHTGPLAAVRGLIEHTARQTAHQAGAADTATAHSLLLLARRVYAIQEDLGRTATRLAKPTAVVEPPAARRAAHRSP
ncbi:relaxase/mobilization nuclease [Streptomyces sp. NPDC052299]|uniref:relaxase/mobilization nuclease n=1 Tax=Streptomyces sp. NPDC052299 TaxID=3155054 RepID=UPI0034275C21